MKPEVAFKCGRTPFLQASNCGKYDITFSYWQECGRRGATWMKCALDDHCAADCVRIYMRKHAVRCAVWLRKEVHQLTCGDYARIHSGGKDGCIMLSKVADKQFIDKCME
ncbi:hypothetical protein EB796_008542 [Bugula neritina]|uniref:lysozyme n=1 Tax=Bugula neritina TaxID=10212 RepID=A0A7J7K3B5_BUGNE|nr:hypothetical protein EB796_008542 [Bugula neritina]